MTTEQKAQAWDTLKTKLQEEAKKASNVDEYDFIWDVLDMMADIE